MGLEQNKHETTNSEIIAEQEHNELARIEPTITPISSEQDFEEIPLSDLNDDDQGNEEAVLLLIEDPSDESTRVKLFTYRESIKSVIIFAAPFTLSRMAVAINAIVNGFVYPKIGPLAPASGGFAGTFVTSICGPVRGALLATGILVGKQNGIVTEYERNNELELASQEKVNIGRTLKQSLVLGTLLAIPSCGLLLSAGSILKAIGISAEVAAQTQSYLTANTYGVLPFYLWTSDQQFAMGTKRKNIPLVSGIIYTGLTMLTGYSLAFGLAGLPKLGVAGLGHGFSIASWVSFLSLRLYFMRSEFKSYHLFDPKLKGIFKDFSPLIKLGLPMGFQALTEWLNLAVLMVLVGKVSTDSSIAALPGLQCALAGAYIINSISQATGVSMSHMIGQMSEAIRQNRIADLPIYNANIKRLGNAGIITGASLTMLLGGLLVSIPRPLASAFLSSDNSVTDDIIAAAQAMLLINGIGLLLDSVRTVGSGALSASKDVLFAPILSFLTMSIIGLSVGGSLALLLNWGAGWLFITRDAGILLAAVGIAHRWLKTDFMPKENNELPTINIEELPRHNQQNLVSRNSSSFFSRAANDESSFPLLANQDECDDDETIVTIQHSSSSVSKPTLI